MQFPNYTIHRINTHGVHQDPRTYKETGADFREAWSECYEFRFFLQDWEGGPVIDGTHYPSAKGYFTCCKPMQRRKYQGPFSCYLFSISTQDEMLVKALNALPTYAFHPDIEEILELFFKMARVDTRQTLDGRLEIWNYANSILRLLLRQQYAVAHTYEGNPRRHQEALLAAKKYLEEHLDEDVNLNKLAADSHLHPTYFHKLFTAAFGRTPAEYLMFYRVLVAREYLRDDNCSISEIAAKCGFSSPSYFSQKFRQHSACSPSKYRMDIRKRRKKAEPPTT